MRGSVKIFLSSLTIALALVVSEWWLFAALALFWLYVSSVGAFDENLEDRTRHGIAWICLGAVVIALFHTGPAWWAGAGMVFWGCFNTAREPLWE
jgi:hypothetical protein